MSRLVEHKPTGKMLDRYLAYHLSHHAVIDIETEGCDELNGSPVLSIGVHVVGPTDLGIPSFYAKLDVRDSYELGFRPEQGTLNWINQLPQAVREDMYSDPLPVVSVMDALTDWFNRVTLHTDVKMLYTVGNSFKFDQQMIQHYYRKLNMMVPWVHWQERDFRTMAGLNILEPSVRNGIKDRMLDGALPGFHEHHALFDAEYEAKIWWANVLEVKALKDLRDQVLAMDAQIGLNR